MMDFFKKKVTEEQKQVTNEQMLDHELLKYLKRAGGDTIKISYGFSTKNLSTSVEFTFHRHDNGGWVSSDAEVAEGVSIGRNSIIMPDAKIGTKAIIGDFVVIGTGATIYYGAHIENKAYVGKGATICQFVKVPSNKIVEENEVWQNCLT